MTNGYVLDADVFISAKDRHYGMSFCPAFWDWLIDRRKANIIFSIKAILNDLSQTPTEEDDEDELSKWVKSDGASLFLAHDQKMIDKFPVVSLWVNSQSYSPAAISTFLGCSDYFLVAHALAHGRTLVTHEVSSNSTNKIKIPNVCNGLNIKCISSFDMIRAEGARFVLEK
jgi:hypothetical protein